MVTRQSRGLSHLSHHSQPPKHLIAPPEEIIIRFPRNPQAVFSRSPSSVFPLSSFVHFTFGICNHFVLKAALFDCAKSPFHTFLQQPLITVAFLHLFVSLYDYFLFPPLYGKLHEEGTAFASARYCTSNTWHSAWLTGRAQQTFVE